MKKNRRNCTHRVCTKRKKEGTPEKRESGITISIKIPGSQNNKEKTLQELLKPLVPQTFNNSQFLTKTDGIENRNSSSSDKEILNPVSASLICKTKGK